MLNQRVEVASAALVVKANEVARGPRCRRPGEEAWPVDEASAKALFREQRGEH